jgi:hypothetical protein
MERPVRVVIGGVDSKFTDGCHFDPGSEVKLAGPLALVDLSDPEVLARHWHRCCYPDVEQDQQCLP